MYYYFNAMKTQSIKQQNVHINNTQNFKGSGVLDIATKGLELCNKYPMVGVSFTDTVATNIPRTIVDLKTGIPAAMETFRRENSGLFVNCLMPSFIVLGVSKLLNRPVMGQDFRGVNMSSSWANGESLEKFADIFKNVKNPDLKSTSREEITSFFKTTLSSLEGLDGSEWVKFSDKLSPEKLNEAADVLTSAVYGSTKGKKYTKELLRKASGIISDSTHATNTLRFSGDSKIFGSNLSEILRDSTDIARKFCDDSVRANLDGFKKQATKLVNSKSILGLAIILPIAMSMQYINRALTRHKYKQKGAPIYKDFEKGGTYKEMNAAEKSKFFAQKLLATGASVGLALLSMMKKPTMSMFQFKGMFPTVDQCRWIATATFVSRIFAAEDSNELRETTVRDMASFAGLYFLGDYAAKIAASVIEKVKPDVKLLNRLEVTKPGDSFFKKAGNWIKKTSLKSFDEVLPNAKNMRSICEIASLGFSIVSLGLILPAYNRKVTEKKVAKAKELEKANAQNLTKNTDSSRLIVELRADKALGEDGVYRVIANDCFK